jgi:hypothetical protein
VASLDDINDVVAAFLVAANDALALTDAGPPARIYTSASRPALDCCGQLTAWAQALGNAESLSNVGGLGGSTRPQKGGAQPVLTVFIQATRCAPTPKESGGRVTLPSPEALAAVSRATNQDLWALWNHLTYELRKGTLAKVCSGAWRDGATAIDNQGGCVGWELVYRYPIDGGYPFEIET